MELEKTVGEIANINKQLVAIDEDIAKQVGYLIEKQRELSKAESALRANLIACFESEEMNPDKLTTVENDYIKATYRKASERRGVDTKKLRAEHPEIYNEYETITSVKSSVVIKVKESDNDKA